ncbi:MAG TPA: DNA polymerase IV [Anaerolineales bacterium]
MVDNSWQPFKVQLTNTKSMSFRKIIHLDLDAFYCAVEEQFDASLKGTPFAVGGRPEQRGVVASCSYAARKFGLRSAMPMARALTLCPQLKIVSGNHKRYSEASRQVMHELDKVARLVEQISIDEAFLDVTENPAPAESIARDLQAAIRGKFELPCSLGVASNKLVAKIATDVGKTAAQTEGPPNAIQVVPPAREAEFLAPLPAEALWGVGPKTAARLAGLGVYTIGEIANLSENDLVRWFGKHGHDLYRRSRGIDHSKVEPYHEAKSVSKETTFPKDVQDEAELRQTLRSLSEGVARRLGRENLAGTTVKVKLRWSDFTTLTRQTTLAQPTAQCEVINETANQLFEETWTRGRPVRLLGVGVSGLGPPVRQLSLWDYRTENRISEKEAHLLAAVEILQQKFGRRVIHWGDENYDG